jgi:maltooligosyltrehalose synthase
VLVVVPLLTALLSAGQQALPIGVVWGDTALTLTDYADKSARNLFTDEVIALEDKTALAALLSRFPVGLFQLG